VRDDAAKTHSKTLAGRPGATARVNTQTAFGAGPRAMEARAHARVRRRRRAWTWTRAFACVVACACVVARARGADARALGARARANARGKVLYARAPASASLERDVERLRCYAAIAQASGRTLVLVDAGAAAPRGGGRERGGRAPATDYVVPANGGVLSWRHWRAGDDARAKNGNVAWCARVERGTIAEAARAIEARFRGARAACVSIETVDTSCGAHVDMVLTSKVDSMGTLPAELEDLLRSGVVRESVLARALGQAPNGTTQSRLALVEERIAERVAARIEERHAQRSHRAVDEFVDQAAPLAASETDASNDENDEDVAAAAAEEISSSQLSTTVARRRNTSVRTVDTSRALVLFAAAAGIVGFFVNSFGFARQASKRDELAALMLDPSASFGAARKKIVVQNDDASREDAVVGET